MKSSPFISSLGGTRISVVFVPWTRDPENNARIYPLPLQPPPILLAKIHTHTTLSPYPHPSHIHPSFHIFPFLFLSIPIGPHPSPDSISTSISFPPPLVEPHRDTERPTSRHTQPPPPHQPTQLLLTPRYNVNEDPVSDTC